MSAKDEKKIAVIGKAINIAPGNLKVKVMVDGQESQHLTADSTRVDIRKPTDQQPGETRDKHFIRMFKGAFFGPNAMRNHSGLKLKKGKRK